MPQDFLKLGGLYTAGACLLALAACSPRFTRVGVMPGEVPDDVSLPDPQGVVTGYAPAAIKVHPLSRLEGKGSQRRAVVHVQLLDAYGHDVIWPGVVSVRPEGVGQTVYIDLTLPERNAAAFDSISRCYVVRCEAPGEGAVNVTVRWIMADGKSGSGGGGASAIQAQGVIAER